MSVAWHYAKLMLVGLVAVTAWELIASLWGVGDHMRGWFGGAIWAAIAAGRMWAPPSAKALGE